MASHGSERLEVLSLIDDHIIKLRERHGLATTMSERLTNNDLSELQHICEMLQ